MLAGMIIRGTILGCAVLMLAAANVPGAQARDGAERDPYSIMTPEPWLAPKYRSPRGLPQRPKAARPRPVPPRAPEIARPAPPTVLPDGRVVPNLPPVRQGIVPGGGVETFGDRAARCAHQSGVFGVPNDQRGTYMHMCTQ